MDKKKEENKKTSEAQIEKENQDIENLPGADEKVETTEPTKSEIEKTSKLNRDGKTDNTDGK